jgi:hypothetical protein
MGEQSPAFPTDAAGNATARFLFTEAVGAIGPAKPAGDRHGTSAYTRGNPDTKESRCMTAIKDDEQQQITDEYGSGL